jgi:hypothetical protein
VSAGSRGPAIASSVLPLVIAGLLTGVAASFLASTAAGRAGLVGAGSILAGMVASAIVQSWLDVVHGDWWANAAGLSLTVAAIAATVVGLRELLGNAAVSIASLTMMFVGNPFSGVGSAPELLPQPVGGLGQLLPRAREGTCCAARATSTAPPPAATSWCSPAGSSPGSGCCSRRCCATASASRWP